MAFVACYWVNFTFTFTYPMLASPKNASCFCLSLSLSLSSDISDERIMKPVAACSHLNFPWSVTRCIHLTIGAHWMYTEWNKTEASRKFLPFAGQRLDSCFTFVSDSLFRPGLRNIYPPPYRILPKSDNKCGKYRWKLIYASEVRTSLSRFSRNAKALAGITWRPHINYNYIKLLT
jgi:hypothetical protein